MITKWLREAESEIVDQIMWGESFHGIDITKVMDGEPVDELLLLLVQRKPDEAMDWLKRMVIHYVQQNELEELWIADKREEERENGILDQLRMRRSVAEAI
jgi:hypothetical protein